MLEPLQKSDKYEIISELARRRGFFWSSYEIYGGVSGFLTYGPLGTLLKQRVETKFREFFIKPFKMLELESSIIMPAVALEASGHVKAFREPMAACLECKRRFRVDHLLRDQAEMSDTAAEKLSLKGLAAEIEKLGVRCPECGGKLGESNYFMTMFETTIGPYSEAVGYGRPEAAQGIFVEFKRLIEIARGKVPFGVVQMGHALRNEISPRQGPIRLREFNIADIEFFFDPKEPHCPFLPEVEKDTLQLIPAEVKRKKTDKAIQVTVKKALEKGYIKTEWQAYFMVLAKCFLKTLGVPDDKQRFIEKLPWERAHYSKQGYDQEIYLDRWGWTEVSGHNYRTDYDLKQHMNHSGADMHVFQEYSTPRKVEETVVSPVPAKIGPTFKADAQKVVTLLSKANAKEVKKSLDEMGHYMADAFKILPEHVKFTNKTIEETGRRFIPHVVEPSFGIDRLVYAALEYAYGRKEDRALLRLPRELAPIQVAVYPLVSKDGIPERAEQLHKALVKEGFAVEYDESGSIGRRYARADEAGTPLCVTIDYETLSDATVTLRDRDSWQQVRTKVESLSENLKEYFDYKRDFEALGKTI